MSAHVTATVRACFAALRMIRSVRRSLPRHALLTLVRALVVSKVDYCNSVLAGLPVALLHRLQSVLNAAETLQKSADVQVRRRLWSAATSTLIVPSTRRFTLGDRAFPVAAARAWNALPSSVRAATSLQSFRHAVKTTLIQAAFTDTDTDSVFSL